MLLLECLLDLIRFLLGAALFSFMNVVAWRLPRGMDPLQGRSHCPQCGHTLGAPDLVPVFSWLFLRGRCRHCGARIPVRYFLVEVLGGVLALGCTRRFGTALSLTQGLFDASDCVGANWPLLLVALALIFFGFKLLLAQPRIRRQWDRFILHAPVVGVLNRKICTARFASTLSNLYGSGVPIITTLGAARDSIGNRWIESQFGTALDSIRAGHSLSQSIAAIDGFEVKLASSIAVGEETGKLDSLLATISETLDYEAEMATKRLVTLLEPVMIVIMGLVVGGVVAAVIVPIYQSYGTIGASSGAI